MTTAEATPRRLHRRRPGAPHLVMLLAGVLGLVLTLAALRGDAERRRVLVAARDLAPGTVLRPADLGTSHVGEGPPASRLVPAAEARRVRGRVVTASVRAGDPLVASQVRPRASADDRRAISIPVERARAVNGRLAPGDRVDVVVARDGVAAVVAHGVEVLEVDASDDGALASRSDEVVLTMAVDVRGAQVLAAALADGDFVLTRVTGAASSDGTPPIGLDEPPIAP